MKKIVMVSIVLLFGGCGGGGDSYTPPIFDIVADSGYPIIDGEYSVLFNDCSNFRGGSFTIGQSDNYLVFNGLHEYAILYGELNTDGRFTVSFHHSGRYNYYYDLSCSGKWVSNSKLEMDCNKTTSEGSSEDCKVDASK